MNAFLHANALALSTWWFRLGNEQKSRRYREIANEFLKGLQEVSENFVDNVISSLELILKYYTFKKIMFSLLWCYQNITSWIGTVICILWMVQLVNLYICDVRRKFSFRFELNFEFYVNIQIFILKMISGFSTIKLLSV